MLRAIEARSEDLDGQLDAIVIGIPRTTPHLPRERPNPLLAAYLGLALALRLWRDAFPLVEGGTAILLNRLDRKSTRLNSSHDQISYAVFCLKKKTDEADVAHLSERPA